MEGAVESRSLEYTPTWIVAGVSFIMILISLCAERALHRLGKLLKHKKQHALFEALEKLKGELMLLGFISLMLTVFQGAISRICVPTHLISYMLPCKAGQGTETSTPEHQQLFHENSIRRHLLSSAPNNDRCAPKGQVPLLSLEALHQLHILIFVLAVVHAIFCVTTMLLGGLRIRQWKHWEDIILKAKAEKATAMHREEARLHNANFRQRAAGHWKKAAIVSWMIAFCKQFYNSVTRSDYIALRQGFIEVRFFTQFRVLLQFFDPFTVYCRVTLIHQLLQLQKHCPSHQNFNFYKYMTRALEADFKKVIGISAFLWMFVIVFLLLNVEGWHTYFWLSFLPLVLLLLVGAKLEHIITRLAQEANTDKADHESAEVKPSDDHFWFGQPGTVLHLIHFILFQNSFEIAFFFWIWSTYGFHSCIMEKLGYITPRLIMGVSVQVLCCYSTLPLYALVAQMGSLFNKQGMFDNQMQSYIGSWLDDIKGRGGPSDPRGHDRVSALASSAQPRAHELVTELREVSQVSEKRAVVDGSNLHGAGDLPVP